MKGFWPLAVLLFTAWAGTALAADVPASGSGEYRFAPGDVIEVTVTPQKDYDRTITVQPDGKISYPLIGQIAAAGRTVDQLAEDVRIGLGHELRDPEVSVSLKEMSKDTVRRVSVYGAVRTPGVISIKDGTTLAEALATSGGPTPIADMRRVTITRTDRSVVTVDLTQTEKTGQLERDVTLQPGDFIVIPEGPPPTVLVMGEVVKPGSFQIQGQTRLLDILSQAGGPTPRGDLRHVKLTRQGESGSRVIDLEPFITQSSSPDPSLNPVLQPGDAILVAQTDQRVYVMGRVSKPDVYQIKPDTRLLDALVLAGGAMADGDISHVALVRTDASHHPTVRQFDLGKMMAKGKMGDNELLRPGDLIFVPDRKAHRSVSDLANLFWPISSLITVLR